MRTSRTHKDPDPADLETRAFDFGVGMLALAQKMKGVLPDPAANALAEHGANIGAHVLEAHAVPSTQLQSYASARQSARQALYWLKLVRGADASLAAKLDPLIEAAGELATALKAASVRARQRAESSKYK